MKVLLWIVGLVAYLLGSVFVFRDSAAEAAGQANAVGYALCIGVVILSICSFFFAILLAPARAPVSVSLSKKVA